MRQPGACCNRVAAELAGSRWVGREAQKPWCQVRRFNKKCSSFCLCCKSEVLKELIFFNLFINYSIDFCQSLYTSANRKLFVLLSDQIHQK